MRLHVESYGQGAPLIILHGLLGSQENWHGLSRRLGQQFHVYALDQRNHGRSPHSPEMDYPRMAEDLREFMDHHHLSEAAVLGHSMGGKTAMQFALHNPERVTKLLVADIAPRAYSPRHEGMLSALVALDLSRFETRKEIEDALVSAVPDLATRRFLLKNIGREPGGAFHWKIGLPHIYRNYPHLGAAVEAERAFSGPTLFLRGEQSDYLREEDEPRIRPLFPRAQFRTIPRAGHLLHVENPDEFLRQTMEFLSPSHS